MVDSSMARVSLIEDSDIHRQWLIIQLADIGLDVVASDQLGRAGIESAKQHRPELIFLDFQLPDITGLEVAKRIKAHLPSTTIFAFTAHTEVAIIERLIKDKHIDAIGIKGSSYFEDNFATIVKMILHHEPYLDPSLLNSLRQAKQYQRLKSLTNREFEVFIQVNIGKSDDAIAKDLSVDVLHVKNLKSKISKKIHGDDVAGILLKLINNVNK